MHGDNKKIGSPDRPLIEACSTLNGNWFPANGVLIERIRRGLHDGIYDLDIDFLFSEIKTDFALFFYCLKELVEMLRKERQKSGGTPLEIFHRAGLSRLKILFDGPASKISTHSLKDMSALQALRLKEAMISASTAEVLAQQHNIDPMLGYSGGLLRQLGLTLISWNYPDAYKKAMLAVQEGANLDYVLTMSLGFSPDLLAVAIIRQWGFESDLQATFEESTAGIQLRPTSVGSAPSIGEQLGKLCEVGEALARANDPEHYPSATADWETAKKALETHLGESGLRLIQTKVKANCESYLQDLPQAFKDISKVDPETRLKTFSNDTVIKSNPFIKGCSPGLKKKIKEAYARNDSGFASKDTVGFIVKEVIPLAGFTGGYIFTFDPATRDLVPRLKVGVAELIPGTPIKYKHNSAPGNPILTAFECLAPIVGQDSKEDRVGTVSIAGVLGVSHRVGVLYLEAPAARPGDNPNDVLTHFKALRQTLNDCLRLG